MWWYGQLSQKQSFFYILRMFVSMAANVINFHKQSKKSGSEHYPLSKCGDIAIHKKFTILTNNKRIEEKEKNTKIMQLIKHLKPVTINDL